MSAEVLRLSSAIVLRARTNVLGVNQSIQSKAALALKLRAIREHYKLTQRQVAERAGLAQKTISDIENARKAASVESIDMIARAFHIPTWQMLTPDIPVDRTSAAVADRLMHGFVSARAPAKQYILQICEDEGKYAKSDQ